ncbi:MAG TPA: retropepsin-like aspartic protease, partial [Methylotenera sp.]
YLSGLIMARTFVRPPLDTPSVHRCSTNNAKLNLGCKLLSIGDAFNTGDRGKLREIELVLDRKDRTYLDDILPGRLFSKLLPLPSTKVTSNSKTNIAITAENNDFLEEVARPEVSFEINNVGGSALFDTGASLTTLSKNDALRYGLQPIDSKIEISSYWGNEKVSAQFYLAKKVLIGNVELSNLVVLVGGEINIIGLDVMTKFGNLIISSNEIIIDSAEADVLESEKKCRSRVFLSSDFLRFNQYLYFVAALDGKKTALAIDSGYEGGEIGTSLPIYENAKNHARTDTINDIHGTRGQVVYSSSVELDIAGTKSKKILKYSPDWSFPTPYVMGWLGLSNHTLILNNQKLRACLI